MPLHKGQIVHIQVDVTTAEKDFSHIESNQKYAGQVLPHIERICHSTAAADETGRGWGKGEDGLCCWSWGSSYTGGRWRWPKRRRTVQRSHTFDLATPKMDLLLEAEKTTFTLVSLILSLQLHLHPHLSTHYKLRTDRWSNKLQAYTNRVAFVKSYRVSLMKTMKICMWSVFMMKLLFNIRYKLKQA